jgi:hypothetical protein
VQRNKELERRLVEMEMAMIEQRKILIENDEPLV